MSDYSARLSLDQHLYDANRQANPTSALPSRTAAAGKAAEQQLEDRAIKSLVDEELVRREADTLHLAASENEINAEVDRYRTAAGGDTALGRLLGQSGYPASALRERLKAQLEEPRIQDQLARARADDALRRLRSGTGFAAVATALSDDPGTAKTGGGLALAPKDLDTIDPPLKAAVGALQPGQTTRAAVHGVNGYYVIRLVSRSDTQVVLGVVLVFSPGAATYSSAPQPPWFVAHLAKLENDAHVQVLVGSHRSGG